MLQIYYALARTLTVLSTTREDDFGTGLRTRQGVDWLAEVSSGPRATRPADGCVKPALTRPLMTREHAAFAIEISPLIVLDAEELTTKVHGLLRVERGDVSGIMYPETLMPHSNCYKVYNGRVISWVTGALHKKGLIFFLS